MMETFNPQLGENSRFRNDFSFDVKNLNNGISLVENGYNLMTMDVENCRIIDLMRLEMPLNIYSVSILHEEDGSSIVLVNTGFDYNKLIKIIIDDQGIFKEMETIPGDFVPGKLIAVEKTKKFWFFQNRINVIDPYTNEIANLDYPSKWKDSVNSRSFSVPFIIPGGEYIFLRIHIKNEDNGYIYFYIQIDVENYTITEISFEESIRHIFFPWNNHDSMSIYKRYKSGLNDYKLYSFNHLTLTSEELFDIGESFWDMFINYDGTKAIIEFSDNGNYLTHLITVDLESRTFKKNVLSIPADLNIDNRVYDPYHNNLYTYAYERLPFLGIYARFGVVGKFNLQSFELDLFNNLPDKDEYFIYVLENSSKIFLHAYETEDSLFYIYDIDKMDFQTTIDITSGNLNYQDQSLLNRDYLYLVDGEGKYLKSINLDYYQIKYSPLKRGVSDGDLTVYHSVYYNFCLFPDNEGLSADLLLDSAIYFDFNSEETMSYGLSPFERINFLNKDVFNNRLVGSNSKNNILYFFESDITYSSWNSDGNYTFFEVKVDEDSGSTWVLASSNNDSKLYFLKFDDVNNEPVVYSVEKLSTTNMEFMLNPSGDTIFTLSLDGSYRYKFSEWSPADDEIIFSTEIFTFTGEPSILPVAWKYIESKSKVFLYDGYGSWLYDTVNHKMQHGYPVADPSAFSGTGVFADYDKNNNRVLVVDLNTKSDQSIIEFDPDNGVSTNKIELPDAYYEEVMFNLVEDKIHLIKKIEAYQNKYINPEILTVHLNGWKNAPTLKPRTNNVEYHPGVNLKLNLTVDNPGQVVNATAYVWFWIPDNIFICFDSTNAYLTPKGIPMILSEGESNSFDLISFNMPDGLPEGYWTVDAMFINNETGQRGIVSNFNFYYRIPQ